MYSNHIVSLSLSAQKWKPHNLSQTRSLRTHCVTLFYRPDLTCVKTPTDWPQAKVICYTRPVSEYCVYYDARSRKPGKSRVASTCVRRNASVCVGVASDLLAMRQKTSKCVMTKFGQGESMFDKKHRSGWRKLDAMSLTWNIWIQFCSIGFAIEST